MSRFIKRLAFLIKCIFTSVNQLQVAGDNAVQMKVSNVNGSEEKIFMLSMSEMCTLLKAAINEEKDKETRKADVKQILSSVRIKRSKIVRME